MARHIAPGNSQVVLPHEELVLWMRNEY
jgi:hypothetical protein